ncbi:hypothetical protein [Pelagovum pacificum]|uniref:Cytochrome c domain-containing protein n=1 Tax=Pelagovum pacificum TaxID=2588711 RepID=A0A5C5GA44_9RHOB|nr:hypothetical protein [Pelagovum pacificum]QQA41599.1 hypothetical protein I8N54_12295 [Pelagovum pacificum]TNY30878.1 hypothetical protein FHY64_17370 [Pelagovum pacificum]
MRPFLPIAAVLLATSAWGETSLEVPDFAGAAVSEEEGLSAWDRIEAVLTHPRCVNCHVEEGAPPMWSGPEFGEAHPHGMNIQGGESRIGAELLPCQTCHRTSTAPNDVPHAPPHAGLDWRLAPAEFVWFDRPGAEICAQLRDPDRNGGRDGDGLVEHILHDVESDGFIAWGFAPGAGRESAPGSLQDHLDDTARWVAAGMPCP